MIPKLNLLKGLHNQLAAKDIKENISLRSQSDSISSDESSVLHPSLSTHPPADSVSYANASCQTLIPQQDKDILRQIQSLPTEDKYEALEKYSLTSLQQFVIT